MKKKKQKSSFNRTELAKRIQEKTDIKSSLRSIAGEVGVSHSTVKRAMECRDLKIDNILLFCDWLETEITEFIQK